MSPYEPSEMPTLAVLFAAPLPAPAAASPFAGDGGVRAGGITVLERQIRQVRRAGATRVVVVGGASAAATDVVDLADPGGLAALLAADDRVLVIAADLVLDERIVRAVASAPAPAVATWPAGPRGPAGTERIDAATVSAGVLVASGAMVADIAARLGEWDLMSTLLRAALADPGVTRIDLSALPTYAPERRRDAPLIWARVEDAAGARAATDALLAAAQKGCLDWPARFLHPPLENAAVRLLLPTPVTPNMVTLLNVAVALAAGVAFATGALWTGLILALVCGPLDGVDGKLARTRLEFSKFGDLEHVLDKIAEYGWFAAIAAHFAVVGGNAGPWAWAAVLVGFALAESLQGEFFRRFTGAQLDDAGAFERRFRLIGARRNTLFWTWLPFAVAGFWYAGFVAMALYTLVTFFVMQARLFVRLGRYGRDQSATIAANFAGSAYELLAKPTPKGQGAVHA